MTFIIYFDDVSGSLQTEQVLKRRGVSCVLDAAPRRPGASCGYVVRAEAQSREALAAVLADAPVRWADILPEGPGKEREFDGGMTTVQNRCLTLTERNVSSTGV